MKSHLLYVLALGSALIGTSAGRADNPLMMDTYAADPTVRLFEGKIYLYPSHDIIPPAGRRGFCMEDYHVYSSENLMDWKDHGVIVTQNEVPWVNPTYGMWAPDCVLKNGKYYFYFPAPEKPAGGAAIAAMPGGGTNPATSIQSTITNLTDEQKAGLTAAGQELNTKMQAWQTASQAALQAVTPQGAAADAAETERYNAELYRQNVLREDLINDAEIKMVRILKADQAEKWETARLNQQVAAALASLGVPVQQKAKLDTLAAQAAKALAAAKDKTELARARADFWTKLAGVLDEVQITRIFSQGVPAARGGGGGGRGGVQRVGVAVAEKPYGPFKPEPTSIPNIPAAIDPCVLIDPKDGAAYLFYSMNAIFVAKLKDNMLEMAEQPQRVANLPPQGLIEGPFVFERKGKYYLTFPHDNTTTERLAYAMADSPKGPYTMKGVIMDEHASGCYTNHHSFVEYKGQWMLFYHDKDLSPNDDARRSTRADYVTFNEDGTINKVIPTLRGVGVCDAKRKIQMDRYSAVSKQGTAVSFLDRAKTSDGWKIALSEKGAFVQYDRVEFGKAALKAVKLRAVSATGAVVEVRLDKADGPVVAKVEIPKGTEWKEVSANLTTSPTEMHNLVVMLPEKNNVEIDWVSFE